MKVLKKIAFVAIICASTNSFAQQAKINGEVKEMGNGEINISYYEGSEAKKSTIKVIDDQFTWTASMPEPQKITIMFPRRAVWVYVEGGTMQFKAHIDSLSNAKLTGSKTQTEANNYEQLLKPFTAQENPLYQKYGKVSKEDQLALEQKLQYLRLQKREIANKYIKEHPESAFSLMLITDRAMMGSYKDINPVYSMLGAKVKSSSEGKRLGDRLAILKRSEIGTPVFNFSQADTEGKMVSFSSFKGKYVLIDFWASWCGPCRAENPNVLKAYNTYKDKDFTVLGISLDDKAENWKKAIKDDGMPWTQLSDLKGFKNAVSSYYGIMAIPSTLLVDPRGNIIAKDLRGAILDKKLEELFSNKSK
ncbi:MAG: AhpC/TSA family protein [Flavobacterium sp.]|nr:MAG: AhpC/TSA family protein [Flavobacterium sp.]